MRTCKRSIHALLGATCALLLGGALAFAVEPADTVFTGGKVYTVNDKQPWAEAVVVKGNKIVYVGDTAGAKEYVGDKTKVIDATGKTVLPGFISTHDHLIASAWTTYGVQLFDLETKEDVLARIKEYAEANPDEKVIKGVGWSAGKFGGNPTAKELDQAVSDRPAILLDFTIHDAWFNTKAMEMAHITKDTPDALPGVTYWVRDDEGNPTGAAIELQWMGPYVAIGAWEPEKMIRESREKLFSLAARNGTTTFVNPGIVTPNVKDTHAGMERDFEAALAMLHELEKKGKLELRTFPQPAFKNKDADPQKFVDFGVRMREQYNSDVLRVQSFKIHPEGNWPAEVAPMLEPYETGKMGTFNVEPDKIAAIILAAAKADMDVATHSDSTGTARAVIDGILASRNAGYFSRSAIHHASWITPEDQKRIIGNRIPINSTPNFSNDFSDTDKDALRLLGEKRTRTNFGRYPYFARAGVSVSLSADVPSTPPDMQAPLFVVQGAVTLKNPADPNSKRFPPDNEPMSVEQAIRGITIEAAWQIRMEDKIGSLEVGKLADLVVLDGNPLEVDPMEIQNIQVDLTMMDGNVTFDRAEETAHKEVVQVKVTNRHLQEAIDIKQLNLLVTDELLGGFLPCCENGDEHDHGPDVALRYVPEDVRKAFGGLPRQGYEFARQARAIHWKKDGQTYWILWTLKDDAAVLWAYDPEAGKAVEILQVRDK